MKRSDFETALALYMEELARQDAKGSTGSIGKMLDVLVRDFILKQGICRLKDVRCRRGGAIDATRRDFGKFETKTGSGAVCYGFGLTKDDLVAENICAGVDFVVWAPFTTYINRGNFTTMCWVFTREDFIDTLEAIGKNGLKSSTHITKHGGQINIQTISPKMEDKLWDILEDLQTLQEWKDSLD